MKALSKLKAEKGIWLVDAPKPVMGHNDLLIKIKKRRFVAPTCTSTTGTSGHKNHSRSYGCWP